MQYRNLFLLNIIVLTKNYNYLPFIRQSFKLLKVARYLTCLYYITSAPLLRITPFLTFLEKLQKSSTHKLILLASSKYKLSKTHICHLLFFELFSSLLFNHCKNEKMELLKTHYVKCKL